VAEKTPKEPKPVRHRCLIVEDEAVLVMGMRADLERLGHTVVGEASTAESAIALFAEKQPDLVFMDIRLDSADGIDVAKRLLETRPCPVIIVSAYSDKELLERAAAAGVFGYLIKPVFPAALAAQMEVAVSRFHEQARLQAEKTDLVQTLETRKLVEKAKGVLMRRANLSEADAHKRLQQESQRRRIGLADLAKKIIESEELLGGKA
jgi:two-component system, response regulator PdtaR